MDTPKNVDELQRLLDSKVEAAIAQLDTVTYGPDTAPNWAPEVREVAERLMALIAFEDAWQTMVGLHQDVAKGGR